MITIKYNNFEAKIEPMGAELKSFSKNNKEYLWCSNPKFWGKSFPILFPNIGFLKNDKTIIGDKEYSLPKHGLARTAEFSVKVQKENSVTLVFTDDKQTITKYPFSFELAVTYTLTDNGLNISYIITNNSDKAMPYCFGLHPAFACPVDNTENFEDYVLLFEKSETLDSPAIKADDGTIDLLNRTEYLSDDVILPLNYKMFENDALIFEKINSKNITLKSNLNAIDIHFEGFTSLGLWTPVDAPFICIEPWCGMNDRSDENGVFEEKYGIEKLMPSQNKSYSLTLSPAEV